MNKEQRLAIRDEARRMRALIGLLSEEGRKKLKRELSQAKQVLNKPKRLALPRPTNGSQMGDKAKGSRVARPAHKRMGGRPTKATGKSGLRSRFSGAVMSLERTGLFKPNVRKGRPKKTDNRRTNEAREPWEKQGISRRTWYRHLAKSRNGD